MKYPKHILLDTINLNDTRRTFSEPSPIYWSPFWKKSFPVYKEALERTITASILQRYEQKNTNQLVKKTEASLFNFLTPQYPEIVKKFKYSFSNNQHKGQIIYKNTTLTDLLFNIHFLRKEFIYTKLKYSRCPQYDIVSGGLAALFSGFIAFLISEKFGIELVEIFILH